MTAPELCIWEPDQTWAALTPYWEGLAAGELRFPCCAGCGRFEWYPAPRCPACGGAAFDWPAVPPVGHVYTTTVVLEPFMPQFAGHTPLLLLIVGIDHAPGVRLVTRLADPSVREIAIGTAVRLVPREVRIGEFLPFAVPA